MHTYYFSHLLDLGSLGEHNVVVKGEYSPSEYDTGTPAQFEILSIHYEEPEDIASLSVYMRRFTVQFAAIDLYPILTREAEDQISEAGLIQFQKEEL